MCTGNKKDTSKHLTAQDLKNLLFFIHNLYNSNKKEGGHSGFFVGTAVVLQ